MSVPKNLQDPLENCVDKVPDIFYFFALAI